MMKPSFDIPQDRKRLKVGRLCLLLGLTVLLYFAVAQQFSKATVSLLPVAAQ